MPLVKVKNKYQVTLPASIRKKVGLAVGDVLDAQVKGKKITLTQKVLIDKKFIEKRLAEGLEDIKKGHLHGPYRSIKTMLHSLRREAKKAKKT